MVDFVRDTSNYKIYADVDDEILTLFLKERNDLKEIWERNPNNTLTYDELVDVITGMPVEVYFQKQKKDEKNNRLRQRILIQVSDERAVEFRTSLWTVNKDAFSKSFCLLIGKFREIDFFKAPEKDTISRKCKVNLVGVMDNIGSDSQEFISLLKEIDALEIPTQEINKIKDQQIWTKYVEALKRLIKQKEQIWKIQKIGQSYSKRFDQYSTERVNQIDISIDEKDVAEQFEGELIDYFGEEEFDDYGGSENNAFFEFASYRELNEEELANVEEMASKYFFMISKDSPIHAISGELKFKYVDDDEHSKIIEQIKQVLIDEYDIELNIDDSGFIHNKLNEIPHISKILADKFGYIASLYVDKRIHHKVSVQNIKRKVDFNLQMDVRKYCKENGFERAYVKLQDYKIVIEVAAYINAEFLNDFGLVKTKQVTRFGSSISHYKLQEIEGTNIVEGGYEIEDIRSKEQIAELLASIRKVNNDVNFHQLPTRYIFEVGQTEEDKDLSRQFKTGVEIEDKVYFNYRKNDLIVTPNNEDEYNEIIFDIKRRFPNIDIEDVDYHKSYRIQFGKGETSQREKIINDIKSKLRLSHISNIEYDAIRNYTRVLFTYNFKNPDERDIFVSCLSNIVKEYKSVLNLLFQNETGTSSYQFVKNEHLEEEKEKETLKNIRKATFIYMTPKQYKEYLDSLEKFGDSAFVRSPIHIGSFINKTKNKFTFKLSNEFDELLNGHYDDYIDLSKGYIKPIFPGEEINIDRMVKAMYKVTAPGEHRNGFPINRNLPNFIFDPNAVRVSDDDIEEEKKRILSNLNEERLANQPKQLEAVAKAMLARDMALIQGPPGTGKTTVIAEIIWQTLSRFPGQKILLTSQTNLAVDNALERLKGKKTVRPIRIGKIEKFEDEGKVYSSDRLNQWYEAKSDSKDEENNSDNAICEWINNVQEQCSKETKFSEIVGLWKNFLESSDKTIKSKFYHSYMEHINVFAATCSECGSRNFADVYQQIFQDGQETITEPEFDVVIMDEASKATPPELILPLTLGKKIIIIGDHKQLPPMIDENEFSEALDAVGAKNLVEDWTKADYKISQFEKLFVNAQDKCVASLDTQFRMHKQIMDCISQFYKDQKQLEHGLICGIEGDMDNPNFKIKGSRWHGLKLDPFIKPDIHAIWVNVSGTENRVGTSYENLDEIEAIKIVLRALKKSQGFDDYLSYFDKDEEKEIGIITYYMPQMQKIKHALYPGLSRDEWKNFEQHKYENEFNIPFRINTVDRFQGMERNIIIISTVRSNLPKDSRYKWNKQYPFALGFAREIPRVNVGFSRAKRLLIVIGNETHFSHKAEYAEIINKAMHRIDIEQIKNL